MVPPKSGSPSGAVMRLPRSAGDIASTSRRICSTGRSVRPVIYQVNYLLVIIALIVVFFVFFVIVGVITDLRETCETHACSGEARGVLSHVGLC